MPMSIQCPPVPQVSASAHHIAKREYVKPAQLAALAEETDELARIFNVSISTARKRLSNDE